MLEWKKLELGEGILKYQVDGGEMKGKTEI